MSRGALFDKAYRPRFSGHETFPLKYGWLKKAVDSVAYGVDVGSNRAIFLADEAIANFGVGKNMVASIRHWAESAGMITGGSTDGRIDVTDIGDRIFLENGWDPFMEDPNTCWLVHWRLCGRPELTTWYWVFNYLPALNFERDTILAGLLDVARDRGWQRVSEATVKRDVDCFIRTYSSKLRGKSATHEDDLESPLVELNLIKPTGKKDGFRMVRGPKPTLGSGVFMYALQDFWRAYSQLNTSRASTLSLEAIAHEPGSPGRVFLLTEDDLVERLVDVEEFTNGAFQWSETAGLKQVLRRREISQAETLQMIDLDYPPRVQLETRAAE